MKRRMLTVEQIKHAIQQLSITDRGRLESWLHGWQNDGWDDQIARDAVSGKLDALVSEVDADPGRKTSRDAVNSKTNSSF